MFFCFCFCFLYCSVSRVVRWVSGHACSPYRFFWFLAQTVVTLGCLDRVQLLRNAEIPNTLCHPLLHAAPLPRRLALSLATAPPSSDDCRVLTVPELAAAVLGGCCCCWSSGEVGVLLASLAAWLSRSDGTSEPSACSSGTRSCASEASSAAVSGTTSGSGSGSGSASGCSFSVEARV